MFKRQIALSLATIFISIAVSAQDSVDLFPAGRPASNYNRLAKRIRAGAKVITPCNEVFTVTRVVNLANPMSPTIILETDGNTVVRVPRYRLSFREPTSLINIWLSPYHPKTIMQDLYEGYQILRKHGAPVVEMIDSQSTPPLLLVFKKIDVQFTWADLFNSDFVSRLDDKKKEEIQTATRNFIRQTAAFQNIGGLGPTQLIYGRPSESAQMPDQWTIVNWENRIQMVPKNHRSSDLNIFQDPLSAQVEERFQSMTSTPQKIEKRLFIPDWLSNLVLDELRQVRANNSP